MNIKEIDFKPILEKAKNKDEESIRELVECTKGYVGFVARSITGSNEAAQDVSQEYYIKLFQNINNINEQSFLAWTNTVIRNCSYDYLRKNNKLNEYGEKVSFVDYDETAYTIKDEKVENQPDKVFEQRERQRFILEIIDSLPLEQREVVIAYFYQEKKIKDIANELNISENTVKSRLAYAKKHIAVKVEELHKKYDIKLYDVAPIGFFIGLLASSRHSHSSAVTGLINNTPKASAPVYSAPNSNSAISGNSEKINTNLGNNDEASEAVVESNSNSSDASDLSEKMDSDVSDQLVEQDSSETNPFDSSEESVAEEPKSFEESGKLYDSKGAQQSHEDSKQPESNPGTVRELDSESSIPSEPSNVDTPIPSDPVVNPNINNSVPNNDFVVTEPSEPNIGMPENPATPETLTSNNSPIQHVGNVNTAAKTAGRHVGRRILIIILTAGAIGGGGFYAYRNGMISKIPFIRQFVEKKSLVCKLPIDDPRMEGLNLDVYTKNNDITKLNYYLVGEKDVGSSGEELFNGILSGASKLIPGIKISSKDLPHGMMQISVEIDVRKVTDLSIKLLESLGLFSQDDIDELKTAMNNIHKIKEMHEDNGFDCYYLD